MRGLGHYPIYKMFNCWFFKNTISSICLVMLQMHGFIIGRHKSTITTGLISQNTEII